MHLARWLTAAALLALLVGPLPGCRKYIALPVDASPVTGGSGGMGGMGGSGGRGGGSGTGGTDAPRPPLSDAPDAPQAETSRTDATIPDTAEPCGTPFGKCCPGGRCGGACCYQGMCVPVGEECPERPELSCFSSSCGGVCGGLRQSCCGANGYCTAPLTTCTRTDASATCETCGNTGEPCCPDSYCEPPGRRCMNGRCVAM
jgi:hypothetical protein